MKKFIAMLLAIMMVVSLATVTFAAGEGSITINTVSKGTTYTIYKMMDLESYNKGAAYSYKVNANWVDFFTTGEGSSYITIDAAGYVTWIAAEDDSTKIEFSQKALAYAKSKTPSIAVSSVTISNDYADTSYTFSGLELGWYLVDTNAGALCGLTTTDPNASVNAKNGKPTIDKQVQEDLDNMWGDKNTADIGQIVNFMTIIHVAAGAENYVLHDAMSEGLTFVQDLSDPMNLRGVTEVKHVSSLGVETVLTLGTDYTIDTAAGDSCDFEVVFDSAYVATLKANDRLIVYYNAMLNRNAVIAGEGNINESWLEYGEEHYTSHDTTKTYTFSIDIVKTDSSNKLIDGAKFRIYDAAVGGNEIAVVPLMAADNVTPVKDAKGNPMYRRARKDETGVEIEVKDGKVTVVGFDNGIYYLEETKAPDGYNKLTSRKEFTISDGSLDSVFNDGIYSTGSGVHVVNKTGTMLPETGATGTALFIGFGTFVMLFTGVLLVTKKRYSMIED